MRYSNISAMGYWWGAANNTDNEVSCLALPNFHHLLFFSPPNFAFRSMF